MSGRCTTSEIKSWNNNVVQIGHRLYTPQLSNRGIDDIHLKTIAELLRKRAHDSAVLPLVLSELNLSDNALMDAGVQALASALGERYFQIRVLKLHKNRLSIAGVHAVASLIESMPRPPYEVHLSHNYIAPAGVRRLLVAAARRCEYPLHGRPLWLRVERQKGDLWTDFGSSETQCWERMQGMLAFAEERLVELRRSKGWLPRGCQGRLICVVCASGCAGCTNKRCRYLNAPHGPIVHLPYAWFQGRCREEDVRMPEGVATSVDTDLGTQPSPQHRKWGVIKQQPNIIYESVDVQVLNKGPHWTCSYDSHSDFLRHMDEQVHIDRRDWHEVVQSGSPEGIEVYLALRYWDPMAWEWWNGKRNPDSADPAGSGAGCVHRLDIGTSGCLVRARTKKGFKLLMQQLRENKMVKTYFCLVHGKAPFDREYTITDQLAYDQKNNETFVDANYGKNAITKVMCLAHLSNPIASEARVYSLCMVRLITGRTHQIRVHMMCGGWPLVSDRKYNPVMIRSDLEWCPRIFLHAACVSFHDSGWKQVPAPLYSDLYDVVKCLTIVDAPQAALVGSTVEHSSLNDLLLCR